MQHLDEGTIHAWLDGQLPADEAEAIAAHARECPECAAMVAEARGLVAASTRILTALDNVPARVTPVPVESATMPIMRRHWYDRTDLRVAAGLLFVAGASLMVVRGERESTPSRAIMTMADNAKSTAPAATDTATLQSLGAETQAENHAANRAAISNAPATDRRARESRTMADAVEKSTAAPEPASAKAMMQAEAAPPPAVNAGTPSARTTDPRSLSEVIVTNVAATMDVSRAPLRVLRVDSSASTTQTVYEISPGREVTLAESRADTAAQRDFAVAAAGRTNEADAQRSADAAKETKVGGAVAGAVLGISGGKIDQTMAMAATAPAPLNAISWTDRGRRYTLTGRLTTKELEVLKPRLMGMRQ